MTASQIFLGIFFGIVGMGYCFSGKRHGNGKLFACGLALGIFPYFVSNVLLLLFIGLALTAYPIVFRGS
jgi:hypothetical protein